MKLSRLVAQATGERQPVPAPSAVHVAFVDLMGQLVRLGLKAEHPLARLVQRLGPSMMADLAEIPADTLAKWCIELGTALQRVGFAEVPHIEEAVAEAIEVEARSAEPRPAGPVPAQPALPAG